MKGIRFSNLAISNFEKKSYKGAEILYITREKKAKGQILDIDLTNCVLFERKKRKTLIKEIYIRHPYKSNNFTISYTDNAFLDAAKDVWQNGALERIHPTATVLIQNGKILGQAGNGLNYHTLEMCERKKLNYPTGTGYHLCNGNHLPENHSEPKAIKDAIRLGNTNLLDGASAYLYGHWWSCIDCSDALEVAGIKKLFISKEWTRTFLEI